MLAASTANMLTRATTSLDSETPASWTTANNLGKTHREYPVSSVVDGTSSVGLGRPTT